MAIRVVHVCGERDKQIDHCLLARSGRDDDKAAVCAAAGFEWVEPPPAWGTGDAGDADGAVGAGERLLPGCAHYLRLVQVGELMPCGEHDLAICRVEGMLSQDVDGPGMAEALSSARLRELGIITDRGKAVQPE